MNRPLIADNFARKPGVFTKLNGSVIKATRSPLLIGSRFNTAQRMTPM